jgi:hypothetical protein
MLRSLARRHKERNVLFQRFSDPAVMLLPLKQVTRRRPSIAQLLKAILLGALGLLFRTTCL